MPNEFFIEGGGSSDASLSQHVSNRRTRVIRIGELEVLVGLKRSSIYSKLDRKSRYFDPTFPRSISLSVNTRGAVGWVLAEVLDWLDARAAAR